VIAGAWRGRPLRAPAGRATRPTSDRVREAIFDVLLALPELRGVVAVSAAGGPQGPAGPGEEAGGVSAGPLAGHRVLDLFAGSGALGIEALSRRAAGCTFVESSAPAVRTLRGNLERLGVTVARPVGAPPDSVVVFATEARRALQADARRDPRYTLVFADPPYDRYEQVRPVLAKSLGRLLAPGAVVVIETGAGTTTGLPWRVVREKRYGDTRVTVLVAGAAGGMSRGGR